MKPPPIEAFELGTSRATYRDYTKAKQSICNAEPRWLQDEVASVNGLISRWLEKVDVAPDQEWTKDKLDLLTEGAERLPSLLAVHSATLRASRNCSFDTLPAFPQIRDRGLELVDEAQAKASLAPAIVAYVTAREALELWRQEQPMRERTARGVCPDRKRVNKPNLYYAWETEEGQTRWLFCIGVRVQTDASGALEYLGPADLSPRLTRKLKPRVYLEAAQAFPPDRVDRPPRLPDSPLASNEKDES